MKVATSILNCDFNKLEEEIKKISTSDYLHLDVYGWTFRSKHLFCYQCKNLKI